MLNQMRSGAGGFLAKLLLILLVMSFSVWGVADMLHFGGGNAAVATIGGQEIPRAAFERTLRGEQENLRNQLGKNYSPELLKLLHLERKALEEMVTAELLRLEARALGIIVPDDAVATEIGRMDVFKNDKGAFDKTLFTETLRRNGMTEKGFEQDLRQQLATRTLVRAVAAGAPVNPEMERVLYAAEHEERTADVADLPPSLVKDVPAPKDADIQAYYDAHKDAFATPEYRTVSYIIAKTDDLMKTINIPEKDLKDAYAEQSAAFGKQAVPFDQVRASLEEDLKSRKLGEAAAAFSVKLEDMLASGEKFADVAKEMHLELHTIGPVDHEGKTPDGSKPALPAYDNFLDAAFKADENTESSFAPNGKGLYVMIHVDAVQPAATQTLDKVRGKVAEAWTRDERDKRLADMADSIAADMKASATPLAVLAKHGIGTTLSGTLTRASSKSDGNKVLPEALVHEIFLTPVNKSTEAYPSGDGHFAIAVVKSRKVPVLAPYATLEKDGEFTLFQKNLEQAAREQVLDGYLHYLRGKYHVKVNSEALDAYASGSQE